MDTYAKELIAAAKGDRGDMDGLIETLSEAEISAAIIEIMHPPMTLRQHFAGLAMQGVLASGLVHAPTDVAKDAATYANALLAELAKDPT
jgi:hypothetical protein